MGLITAQEVKSNTSMGGNVDSDLFNHIINDVQVMILENVLGTKLYDKIVTDFNEGGTNNLAGDYLTMFNDYIKPVLWHSVFAEYLRGYGLVVLLDHGKGDMTLYGYNQTLLKQEGDKVKEIVTPSFKTKLNEQGVSSALMRIMPTEHQKIIEGYSS